MDFGVVGFDNLAATASFASENNAGEGNKHKWCSGFPFLKQINGDEFRDFKLAKTSSFFGYGYTEGAKGPFSPSQWMELEHQALIYKYITSNVPIPSYLLNPITKVFQSAGYSTVPALRATNSLGWGGLHLGYCNNDPEPGRCRRTDGKKWRCSKEAVADQKYCERHMNRGRHRSRKPVEGQSCHSSAATSNTSKPTTTPPGSGSNGHGHNQLDNLYQYKTAPKQHHGYEESMRPEFGLVGYDSLLNTLNKSSSPAANNVNDQGSKSLKQFIDNWPDLQPDSATQLSISTPMATSDIMSSPAMRKVGMSPLSSSQELEMGLGVGNIATNEQKQAASWVPIAWESPMGGPLGEVLHTGDCKNTKPLNLMESWYNNSRGASPPTAVCHKGTITSVSNSSVGSSPKAESSTRLDGASRCIGFISPGAVMNPSLPAL